ncbi:MAG TPA: DUF4386 domain-containing protein [Candidatus Limnocylindria bacterium]
MSVADQQLETGREAPAPPRTARFVPQGSRRGRCTTGPPQWSGRRRTRTPSSAHQTGDSTAGFRAVQAVIAIGAVLNLFTAFRLLQTESLAALGSDQLHAQVLVLLSSFGYEWSLALVIFGIHLGLLGYLVYRSGYIPRLVGVALAIAGIGYVVYNLRPYLYPDAEIGFVFAAFFGELVFLVWLAIWGWRIPEPIPTLTH